MKKREKNGKLCSSCVVPTLDAVVEQWREARRGFLRRSGRESFERFHETTTMLFVAFIGDHTEKPWAVSAFESFRKAIIAAEADETQKEAFHPFLLLR